MHVVFGLTQPGLEQKKPKQNKTNETGKQKQKTHHKE
jgi:hypothetical protein